jgi:hypothetical protein
MDMGTIKQFQAAQPFQKSNFFSNYLIKVPRTKSSLTFCSPDMATDLYPESSDPTHMWYQIKLSSHLHRSFPMDLFSSESPTEKYVRISPVPCVLHSLTVSSLI